MRVLSLLAVCAALVGVCDASKCKAVTYAGVTIADVAAVVTDMGNVAPADLILKSSYEAWSINELTYLKAGTWPTSGDTCTAGAGCATDDEVAAKCSTGASGIEIAKANLKMSVAQINAVCGFAGDGG